MKVFLKKITHHHRIFWKKDHIPSLLLSVLFLSFALIVQRLANLYVSGLKALPVHDVLLDRLPTLDIDFLIIISTLAFTFITVSFFYIKPKYVNFGIKTLSLFIIVRSFFISLTHLGISPHELHFDSRNVGFWLYNVLYHTRGDFFFSGHTGLPFLLALIFWLEIKWRFFCLIVSALFAVGVLFAHIHYSIDVFAAPFMAYGIFSIAKYIFQKDYIDTRTS